MRPLLLLPLVLPAGLLAATPWASPWGRMWTLILGAFYLAKWWTWFRAVGRGSRSTPARHLGYLLTWPGMNAAAFLDAARRGRAGNPAEWATAVLKTAFGAYLIWGVCPRLRDSAPWSTGWVGVAGLGFLLFFGLFHLLSLGWRAAGADAPPQWRYPLFATSVSDFWSNRWNLAFRQLMHQLVFRPAARRLGATGAMTLVFLASGLAHEVVLSLPAGGGYGLPTAYFLIQAGAVAFERSRFAEPLVRAGGALGGWSRAFCLVAVPAWMLFHPPFLEAVILPGLRTIGAA